MRLLGNGRVWLDEGEVVPVMCDCGAIYQPIAGTFVSSCPRCQKTNIHDDQAFTKRFHVERKGRDY